jgi:hypothetical protein
MTLVEVWVSVMDLEKEKYEFPDWQISPGYRQAIVLLWSSRNGQKSKIITVSFSFADIRRARDIQSYITVVTFSGSKLLVTIRGDSQLRHSDIADRTAYPLKALTGVLGWCQASFEVAGMSVPQESSLTRQHWAWWKDGDHKDRQPTSLQACRKKASHVDVKRGTR